MAFETREGAGQLFRVKEKKSDRAPDYRGEVRIGGQLHELAGWKKMDKRGEPFLSLSIREPRETPSARATHAEGGEF